MPKTMESRMKRRRLLQLAFASGLSGVSLSQLSSSASATHNTYDVAIYISDELYDYGQEEYSDGYVAQDRAATYIDGAFGEISYKVNLTTPNETVWLPTENYNTSFTTSHPCHNETLDYASILPYFKDWVECKNVYEAADSNILLTADGNTDGGRAYLGGNKSVAQTGTHICDLSSRYSLYGTESWYDGMHTALHEVGHNHQLTQEEYGVSSDDEYDVHNVGNSYDTTSNRTFSPLATPDSTNECNENVPPADDWHQTWSECSVDHWSDSE